MTGPGSPCPARLTPGYPEPALARGHSRNSRHAQLRCAALALKQSLVCPPLSNAGSGGLEALPAQSLPPTLTVRLLAKFYRSEEHTSELQSLMRTSYAVLCLKKKKANKNPTL